MTSPATIPAPAGAAAGAPAGVAPPVVPEVWVTIPVWNGCADTVECLESLSRLDWPRLRVLVVDNGSTDGTAEVLGARFPWVEVLPLGQNLGFTGGCNAAMAHAFDAGADFVLLLNNDTLIDSAAVGDLVSAATSWPDCALVSPLIFYYAAPDTVWFGGGRVDVASGLTEIEYGGSTAHPITPYRTAWVSGCALLIPRRAHVTVGGLDPAYFASYEDVDLSLRARRAGFDLVLVPSAKVWHKVSASWRGQGQFYYYTVRNRLRFIRKFGGRRRALGWAARLGGGALAYAAAALFRRRTAQAKAYLFTFFGVLAFLRGAGARAPRWVYDWGAISTAAAATASTRRR
jgi:GT2 family glycosyltransferase